MPGQHTPTALTDARTLLGEQLPVPSSITHLLRSKLLPESQSRRGIARTGLVERLDSAARRKLVLLSAMPGAGKSTLLAHWHAQHQHERQIAWLSIDEHDVEPARFFAHLRAAIGHATQPARTGALWCYRDDTFADELLGTLDDLTSELWIVLDDLHLLAHPGIVRTLGFLVRRSPRGVHWVLSTRAIPEIELGELALQDELEVLGEAELRFTSNEVRQLALALDVPVADEVVRDIHSRCEGWAAGIKFALRALAAGADETDDAGVAAQYFDRTVVQQQSTSIRTFLLATALLDRMHPDLCNAMLGIDNSRDILDYLRREQLFVFALDRRTGWLRYHGQLLTWLRSRASGLDPSRVSTMHVAASRWLAAQGLFAEALRHAFDGNDRDWCCALVRDAAKSWLRQGDIASVLQWTHRLARHEILADEVISSAHISALILGRRFSEAAAALRDAQAEVSSWFKRPVGQRRLVVLQTMLALLTNNRIDETMLQSLPADEGVDTCLTGTLMSLQAYRLLKNHQFAAARRRALRAADVLLQQNSVFGYSYAEVLACIAERSMGDFEGSAERCERLYARMQLASGSPAWVNAANGLTMLRYEQNRIAEAETLCTDLLPLLAKASTLENFARAHLTAARLAGLRQDMRRANHLLDHLHALLEAGPHNELLALVCFEKVRLHLAQDDTHAARIAAAEFRLDAITDDLLHPQALTYDAALDRFGTARALIHLHAHEFDACRTLLNTLIGLASGVNYVNRVVPLLALRSVCEFRSGERSAAFASLNRAHAQTRRYGFTRSVFDETPGLGPVLAAAVAEGKLQYALPAGYTEKYREFVGVLSSAQHTGKVALPMEPLTTREIEVLRLVVQGLSNQQISTETQVALATVKWHLTNVFAKLAVKSRTGAVARVRDLQLPL